MLKINDDKMRDAIILRYGEISLKGKNRGIFERKLVENIKDCLKKNNVEAELKKVAGRIFVYADKSAVKFLKNVFGLVSLSPATEIENDFELIKRTALVIAKDLDKEKGFDTFRITTKRPNKDFFMHAGEIDIEVGALVADTLHKKVSMKGFDLNIGIEILDKTYIFTEKIAGYGGLPFGSSGDVVCLISRAEDVFAAWLMARRGCKVNIAIFGAADIEILQLLKRFWYGCRFLDQKVSDLGDAEAFLDKTKSKAFVIGQTFDNFDEIGTDVPVLRPLIGYDDEEIRELEERIKA